MEESTVTETMSTDEIIRHLTQEILRPDSADSEKEAIKFVLKNLNVDKFATDTSNSRQKCQQTAIEKISAGNKLFDTVPYLIDSILKLYTEAIAYAPNDSLELIEAYSYRSAVLAHARLFEDSSKDIDRVLRSDYPENLKAKLYVRQLKNLLILNIKNRSKIEEVVTAAHRWIEETDDDYKNILKLKLQELSEQKLFLKPFPKSDNSHIVPDICNPHKKLMNASDAIELKYSTKFGRHFVATRDIKPSEILVKQQAYVIAPSNKILYTYCWHCSKRAWSSVPCQYCTNVVFCSEECYDEAWDKYHDIECTFIDFISLNELTDVELIGVKMTIQALKEAGSIEALKNNLEAINEMSDPLYRGFMKEIVDETEYTHMYTLTRSFPFKCKTRYYAENLIKCVSLLFALARSTKIFGDEIDTMNDLADNELALFMGGLLIRNADIAEMNSYDIANLYADNQDSFNRGIQISCLTSFFNHSCDPNACMVHSANIMGIRSIQTIKEGEQIFVNYINRYEEYPTSYRQKIHEDRYNFLCECHACEEYWGPHSEWPSYMEQPLSNLVKYKIRKKFAKFCKNFDGFSPNMIPELMITDPSYIPLLLELLNTLCNNADYPCNETCVYKGLLNEYFEHHTY